MYYPGRQEGQFDIGLVNRWGDVQAGGFGSFKWLDFKQYQNGGTLGQAAFLVDYLFSGGRIGAFVTRGFKNYAVLNSVDAGARRVPADLRARGQPGRRELPVRRVGQRVLPGRLGLPARCTSSNAAARPGVNLELVQPLTGHIAFTAAGSYNETYTSSAGSGTLTFGLQVGNYIHPREYAKVTTPVPMDVPRIRYEFGTRRVGSSPPIADAGPHADRCRRRERSP